ncbi:MAG: hypothetical protein ACAH59_06380 [Pseudobdellovibrionaceae bacterium]
MKKIKARYLAIFAVLLGIGAGLLIFTNADTQQPAFDKNLTFSAIAPFSTDEYLKLAHDVGDVNGDNEINRVIRDHNYQTLYDRSWKAELDPSEYQVPEQVEKAKIKARLALIRAIPDLTLHYLAPLLVSMRRELANFGFEVDPPITVHDRTVVILGAKGTAALTAVGKILNRNYYQYGTYTVLDPLLSLGDRDTMGAFGRLGNWQRMNVDIFLMTKLGTVRNTDNVFLHESYHARTHYHIISADPKLRARELDAGKVEPHIAKKYFAPTVEYGSKGFIMDEANTQRVSSQAGMIFSDYAFAASAASMEVKISLFNDLQTGALKYETDANKVWPGAKGLVIYNDNGYLIIPNGSIAMGKAAIENFLRKSITKSMRLQNFIVLRFRNMKPGTMSPRQTAHLNLQIIKHSNLLKFSTLRAHPRLFGKLLATPIEVPDKTRIAPTTADIQKYFGYGGEPQKAAAFQDALMIPKEMGVNFSKVQSADGKPLSPAAVNRLAHLDRVMNQEHTGEHFTAAEIAALPPANISQSFAAKLNVGMKAVGPAGAFLFGKEALAALEAGTFSNFIQHTAIGGFVFLGGLTVVKVVAGAAIAGPIGAALAIGSTLGEVINMTVNATTTPDDALRFVKWVNSVGAALGSNLQRFILGAANVGQDSFTVATRDVGYFAGYKGTLGAATILTSSSVLSTPEVVNQNILNTLNLDQLDISANAGLQLDYLLTAPSPKTAVNVSSKIAPILNWRKAGIKLRFVCSAWMFLKSNPSATSPDAENRKICAQKALEAFESTKKTFEASDIPIQLSYSWEIERGKPYAELIGRGIISAQQRQDNANDIDAMPAIEVTSTYFVRKSFTETCPPTLPTSCGSPTSTVTVSYLCINYPNYCPGGVMKYPPMCTCGIGKTCYWPCECRGLGGVPGNPVIPTNCATKEQYDNPTLYATSNRNFCGCIVGWDTTKPFVPKSYRVIAPDKAKNWLKTKYSNPLNTWQITVGITPFSNSSLALNNTQDVHHSRYTANTAMFDALTMTAQTFTSLGKVTVNPTDFFSQYGYISVTSDAPRLGQVVAHQIGHLFGAVHERATWASGSFYTAQYTNLVNRESAAETTDFMSTGFLSAAKTLAFSSSEPTPAKPVPVGNYNRNNRNQVIRTLMFLTKNQIIERPTDVAISYQGVKTDTPPPPVINFDMASNATLSLTNRRISYDIKSFIPVSAIVYTVDAGAETRVAAGTDILLPSRMPAGRHTLYVDVIDASGGTQTYTQPFNWNPSQVMAPILSTVIE